MGCYMSLINTLQFDDLNSADYGVYLSGEGAYNAPARRGEMVTIPGKSGTLFMGEDAFENIEVTYPAFIGTKSKADFRTILRELRSDFSAVKTYARLSDTYHPDEFRLGVFRSGVETDPAYYNQAGEFDLTFDCKPQRYLTSGEVGVTFSENGVITNPTPFAARPLIKISGNGNVIIGDYQFSVQGSTDDFWLDSELYEAYIPAAEVYDWTDNLDNVMTDELQFTLEFANGYVNSANWIRYVTFKNHKFPKIEPGTQPVGVSGGIEIEIIPRWWML